VDGMCVTAQQYTGPVLLGNGSEALVPQP
jgi:hypothetical protein